MALAVPAAVLAGSGQGGFDGVVHSIESRYHVHATRIPFLGLISLVSKKATHGGVGSLHVAEFESFTEQVDGDELNRLVAEKLGAGWERMIRETSKKGHEQTLIFMHPEGDAWGCSSSISTATRWTWCRSQSIPGTWTTTSATTAITTRIQRRSNQTRTTRRR